VSPRLRAVAAKFNPMLILISGCQDNQTSMDGDRNGAFTEQLKAVWKEGTFTDDYARFHASIKARMPLSQTPNLFVLGDAKQFLTQRPFDVMQSARVK
jgi:metacaspase-1